MAGRTHPPFSSLPLKADGPPGNAWGLFGPDDELGMLNLLTPENVAAAAKEIKTGVRISLDWPLTMPSHPSFGRNPVQHEIRNRSKPGQETHELRVVNDDILNFNTQSSSQWDSFRHYGYLKAKRYFNGHTHEELESTGVLGINLWVEKGGIVGRGVLLDYADWTERNNISSPPLESTKISLKQLQQIAEEEAITFRPGDILFIRSGFTKAYEALNNHDRQALAARATPRFNGVEPSTEVLQWLWENQFSAVAGDAPSFEVAPVGAINPDPDISLHQWLLAGWGMPIGEMFDLEALSWHCKDTGRYSFFLSSVPLKVPGGVASPPNAIAIF